MDRYSNDKPTDAIASSYDEVSAGHNELTAGLGGVVVDREADVPIGVQLAWSLRARIGTGELVPGQRLPGLRDLAEAAGVNVNTVRAVYQRLEQEGFVDSQQGSGTFVASAARPLSAAGTIAAEAAREARDTGVDPREVAAALYVAQDCPVEPEDPAPTRRRLLRAEIAALERTLGEMEAAHPGAAPPPTQLRGVNGPMLLGAGELERVRGLLVRRLSALQEAIDGRAEADRQETAAARTRPHAQPATQTEPSKPSAPKRGRRPRSTTRPAAAGT
jgi:DNA-binding transcriptional regulator YhcF (GntR family)